MGHLVDLDIDASEEDVLVTHHKDALHAMERLVLSAPDVQASHHVSLAAYLEVFRGVATEDPQEVERAILFPCHYPLFSEARESLQSLFTSDRRKDFNEAENDLRQTSAALSKYHNYSEAISSVKWLLAIAAGIGLILGLFNKSCAKADNYHQQSGPEAGAEQAHSALGKSR